VREVNTPTHKTYTFSTFQELVDRVPAEKIMECMGEIGKAWAIGKATCETAQALINDYREAQGLPPNPTLDRVIQLPEVCEWIDDGLGEVDVTLQPPGGAGNGIEIKIRKQNEPRNG
jgi:hypothetical protein